MGGRFAFDVGENFGDAMFVPTAEMAVRGREIGGAKEDGIDAGQGQNLIDFGDSFARFDERDEQRLVVGIAQVFLHPQAPFIRPFTANATDASGRVATIAHSSRQLVATAGIGQDHAVGAHVQHPFDGAHL